MNLYKPTASFMAVTLITTLLSCQTALAYTYFDVGGEQFFSRIDGQSLSNPTKINLLSELQNSYSATLQIGKFGKAWRFSFQQFFYKFKPDPSLQFATIEGLSGDLFEYQAARWWRLSSRWGTEFAAGLISKDFLMIDYQYLNFSLQKKTLPGLGFNFRSAIYRMTEANRNGIEEQTGSGIYANFAYKYFLSSTDNTNPENFAERRFGIEYVQKLSTDIEMNLEGWSQSSELKTMTYDQKNQDVGFKIKLVYRP